MSSGVLIMCARLFHARLPRRAVDEGPLLPPHLGTDVGENMSTFSRPTTPILGLLAEKPTDTTRPLTTILVDDEHPQLLGRSQRM